MVSDHLTQRVEWTSTVVRLKINALHLEQPPPHTHTYLSLTRDHPPQGTIPHKFPQAWSIWPVVWKTLSLSPCLFLFTLSTLTFAPEGVVLSRAAGEKSQLHCLSAGGAQLRVCCGKREPGCRRETVSGGPGYNHIHCP